MEWGNFITVIIAIYLAWYGFNFLFDLFVAGRPKIAATAGIHYKVSDLMAEEEKAQLVHKADYEEKPVEVHQTEPPVPSSSVATNASAADNAGQNSEILATPAVAEPAPPAEAEDWASVIDQEEPAADRIEIPVQGQAVSVTAYLQSLRDQARLEAQSISF
ncbi:hypothetical protein [Adhaeribacter rhizoryzae]|uniref:Uncharacterized protein n=1 Tax=Adhaeribacter rhizoryzae TaxID=2607907 RepID=A0A5M6CV63_9BACT|nr:hypothetical protein [Adhaeribacter rhizoryzae]KAA5539137.1 hypothetical protein F0145_25040 [Adhaeribacter rhizoryzae]